jgi:formylglycine-generating enzyme required for sulfatase activity
MARIPGGRFFMGSDDDLPMEKPAHNVTLSPYCMDVDEVTTGDYKACSDAGGCKRAGTTNQWEGISGEESKTYDPLCNSRDPIGLGKHPINCVDWEMASIYCGAQNKRLPTEAEWEFAARGPDGRKYPWGDEEPNGTLLNACGPECTSWAKRAKVDLSGMYADDDGFAHTAPVGSFPRGSSPYGIHDIVGNVWEWVADFYQTYSKEDAIDPVGPTAGDKHVIRGGAWNGAYSSWVRPTFRYRDSSHKRSYGIGFRCAASVHDHSGGASK